MLFINLILHRSKNEAANFGYAHIEVENRAKTFHSKIEKFSLLQSASTIKGNKKENPA